jgi:hypothetical protein
MNQENGNHYSTIFKHHSASKARKSTLKSSKRNGMTNTHRIHLFTWDIPCIIMSDSHMPFCLHCNPNPTTCIDFERQKLLHSRLIIDSKLAPIFQIVTHPPRDKCTKKLDKVCPYGYGPVMESHLQSNREGGAAVINLQQQSNALLLIFLQACARASSSNFIPPLVTSSFRAHTGQASSLIRLFLLPNERFYLLEKVRPLKNLARVLTSRPPLSISKYWPSHLLSQIPLRCLVQQPLQPNSYTRIDLSTTVGDL